MTPDSCRALSCTHPLARKASPDSRHLFYCSTHWEELENYLRDHVEKRIYPLARSVYVGRTNYPERRLLEHRAKSGRDQLAVLHWSADWEEVAFLEKWLIDNVGSKRKSDNEERSTRGRWSGSWNCVYLSWSWKSAASPSTDLVGTSISWLDDGRRLAPRQAGWPTPPALLRTDLLPDQARQLVEGFRQRRRAGPPA